MAVVHQLAYHADDPNRQHLAYAEQRPVQRLLALVRGHPPRRTRRTLPATRRPPGPAATRPAPGPHHVRTMTTPAVGSSRPPQSHQRSPGGRHEPHPPRPPDPPPGHHPGRAHRGHCSPPQRPRPHSPVPPTPLHLPPPPPGWNKHPPLPGPAHLHAALAAGLPSWQITLIAEAATVIAAVLAVLARRTRAARRRVPATTAEAMFVSGPALSGRPGG
jgi:hypothetical protein